MHKCNAAFVYVAPLQGQDRRAHHVLRSPPCCSSKTARDDRSKAALHGEARHYLLLAQNVAVALDLQSRVVDLTGRYVAASPNTSPITGYNSHTSGTAAFNARLGSVVTTVHSGKRSA